jgi:hypothetical protein
VRLEGLGKMKKSTSSRTRSGDLPACSIVPQPTTIPRAPLPEVSEENHEELEYGGNRMPTRADSPEREAT